MVSCHWHKAVVRNKFNASPASGNESPLAHPRPTVQKDDCICMENFFQLTLEEEGERSGDFIHILLEQENCVFKTLNVLQSESSTCSSLDQSRMGG